MPVLVLNSLTPNQWTVKVQDSLDTIHHFTTHAARRKFLGMYELFIFVFTPCRKFAKNEFSLDSKSVLRSVVNQQELRMVFLQKTRFRGPIK